MYLCEKRTEKVGQVVSVKKERKEVAKQSYTCYS